MYMYTLQVTDEMLLNLSRGTAEQILSLVTTRRNSITWSNGEPPSWSSDYRRHAELQEWIRRLPSNVRPIFISYLRVHLKHVREQRGQVITCESWLQRVKASWGSQIPIRRHGPGLFLRRERAPKAA